jgi:hypothetical protein
MPTDTNHAWLHGRDRVRPRQERERRERERVVRSKVAACAFARGYLGGIVASVMQQLQDTGYFFDPVEREVSGALSASGWRERAELRRAACCAARQGAAQLEH